MIALFLADGFEEIEALTPLDYLRRVGVETVTFGVTGKTVTGAHGIPVVADRELHELNQSDLSGVILPGGMPGTRNLENAAAVKDAVNYCMQNRLMIAAICAAPSVLGHMGLLKGKKAVCFPGFEKDCIGAEMGDAHVVTDGNIITAKGAGCADRFGAAIVTYLKDKSAAESLLQGMQW